MKLTHQNLIDAGVHYGHLTKKWHPNMAPFIFSKRNKVHIINVNMTLNYLKKSADTLKAIAQTGKKILFIATKKQVKNDIAQEAKRLDMPYVTERWLGGMLTNFVTIRKSIKKLDTMDKMLKDEKIYKNLAKRERLTISREQIKIDNVLHGIVNMTRLPAAIFVVDVNREETAIQEAKKLGIPIFAIVDTNANPDIIDYPIPSNDDSSKAVKLLVEVISNAIEEGLNNRKQLRAQSIETTQKTNKQEQKKDKKFVKINTYNKENQSN